MINPGAGVCELKLSMELVTVCSCMIKEIILPPMRRRPVGNLVCAASCEVDVKVTKKKHNIIVVVVVSNLLINDLMDVLHGILTVAVCLRTLSKLVNAITEF